MLPLALLLAFAAQAEDARVLVTIESDLPGATARIDDISADLALPVTLKLAPGAHDVVLAHASLPPLRMKLAIAAGIAQRFALSIEDPEHAPIVKLIHASADDDVAIDGRLLVTPIPEVNTVTPGAHDIALRRRGSVGEKRVRLVLERGQTAVFDLGGASKTEAPKQAIAPIIPQAQPAKKSSALATAGWIAIGAGAASTLSFAYFTNETFADISREEEARTSPTATRETVEPHQEAARRHALAANLTLGVALIAAGAGVIMVLVAD
jgi:hypothetical protein